MKDNECLKVHSELLEEVKKCNTKDQVKKLLMDKGIETSDEMVDQLFSNVSESDALDKVDLESVSGGAVKTDANKTWAEQSASNLGEKKVVTLNEYFKLIGADKLSPEEQANIISDLASKGGALCAGDGSWYLYK